MQPRGAAEEERMTVTLMAIVTLGNQSSPGRPQYFFLHHLLYIAVVRITRESFSELDLEISVQQMLTAGGVHGFFAEHFLFVL